MKLFLKGNEKLTFAIAIGILSTLTLSIALAPTFNMLAKAQNQSQGVQQQLVELSEKVKELGSKAGLNLTIAQGGNLTGKSTSAFGFSWVWQAETGIITATITTWYKCDKSQNFEVSCRL